MSLLPKSIHWCRRYPTKFNSGRDIPQDRSNGFMFASGLALTGALFIRSQLFNYVIVLLLITVAATALWWWRDQRRLVAALLTLIAKSSKHENAKQPHWAQARSSCWGTRSPPL